MRPGLKFCREKNGQGFRVFANRFWWLTLGPAPRINVRRIALHCTALHCALLSLPLSLSPMVSVWQSVSRKLSLWKLSLCSVIETDAVYVSQPPRIKYIFLTALFSWHRFPFFVRSRPFSLPLPKFSDFNHLSRVCLFLWPCRWIILLSIFTDQNRPDSLGWIFYPGSRNQVCIVCCWMAGEWDSG